MDKKLKIIFLATLFCISFFAMSGLVSADFDPGLKTPEVITNLTSSNQSDLAQYLKYVFDFGIALGLIIVVVTLAVAGVFYIFSSASPLAMQVAKDRISGAISGFLILILTYLIITTINPYLSFFKMNPLEKVDIKEPEKTEAYGVNFYKSEDCSEVNATHESDVPNLGTDLSNLIKSVKISQNSDAGTYYISILYDNPNFWGQCQYIDPNSGCQNVKIPAVSASIYPYDFSPSGDVTLYRESFNSVAGKEKNKYAGYLKLSSYDIGELYWEDLSNLKFTGTLGGSECKVPENDRDCARWNEKGICEEKKCPTLDGENLTSIKVDGNYLVLLLYIGPKDDTDNYVYSYCQAFPKQEDVNKIGPQQIKWDAIRSSGRRPNYILIIPVQKP